MLISALLRHAASATEQGSADEIARSLDRAGAGELEWALDAGLGPWLHWATADSDKVPVTSRQRLLGAELTAKIQNALRVDTALEVIDCSLATGAPVTLLKGISIGEQHYPAEHLRLMTDIDLLVPSGVVASIERDLLRRGYRHGPDTLGPDTHHCVPLRHPELDVWVELHHDLFPSLAAVRRSRIFDAGWVAENSIASAYHGRHVLRLSDELQLVYIAAFWVRDLSMHRIHPSFVTPVLDAVCLLASSRRTFDWCRLIDATDNDQAAASLYLLAAFLAETIPGHIPASVVPRLQARQSIVGPLEYRLTRLFLQRYLLGGRRFTLFNSWHVWSNLLEPGGHAAKLASLPWRIVFPPGYVDRYDPRMQAGRFGRLVRRLGGRR